MTAPQAPEGRQNIAHGASHGVDTISDNNKPRKGERAIRAACSYAPPGLHAFNIVVRHVTHGSRRGLHSYAPPGLVGMALVQPRGCDVVRASSTMSSRESV